MKDLLVKVGGLVFLVNVVILDVNNDTKVPIILGHPFLVTSHTFLNIQDGKALRAGDEDIKYYLLIQHSQS